MPYAYSPLTRAGSAVALDNEMRVLTAVRNFGHLRRQEIAMACWPKTSFGSSKEMANRTVRRLLEQGSLIERANSLGGHSLILGAKGVSRLISMDVSAQSGYELSFDGPQFFHRTLGTCYLLEKAKHDHEVYGEYAILKGWSPISRDYVRHRYGKVPDGLIMYSAEAMGIQAEEDLMLADWVEVESAFKSYEEVKKALSILLKSPLLNEAENVTLNKLVFVFDQRQRHDRQLLRYIQKFLKEVPDIEPELLTRNIVFASCAVEVPFTWYGASEVTVDLLLGRIAEDFNDVSVDEHETEY